jgi:hypothetical protein
MGDVHLEAAGTTEIGMSALTTRRRFFAASSMGRITLPKNLGSGQVAECCFTRHHRSLAPVVEKVF